MLDRRLDQNLIGVGRDLKAQRLLGVFFGDAFLSHDRALNHFVDGHFASLPADRLSLSFLAAASDTNNPACARRSYTVTSLLFTSLMPGRFREPNSRFRLSSLSTSSTVLGAPNVSKTAFMALVL